MSFANFFVVNIKAPSGIDFSEKAEKCRRWILPNHRRSIKEMGCLIPGRVVNLFINTLARLNWVFRQMELTER